MKKILDRLLEMFGWVYEIFLYSLILPLSLGVIWLFSDVYIMLYQKLLNWSNDIAFIIKIPILICIGICLKILRNNYLKKQEIKKQ